MSPKAKITKQEIIDAAFNIADNEGFHALSVRKVAATLGCSVAPIYVNFDNAESLGNAVAEKAHLIHIEMCSKPYSHEPFLNMGIGTLMFAYQHKQLYKDIIESKNQTVICTPSNHPEFFVQMRKDEKLTGFDDASLQRILFKMSTFTNGLCVFASAETMPNELTIDHLCSLLEETGNDVIDGERKRVNLS